MSADKYPGIFSRQMEAIVYLTEAIKGLSYSVLCIHKVLVQKVKHLAVCRHVATKSG